MHATCVFVDTEFTDFCNMDLISIGAVTERGDHQFYQEVTDYRTYLRSAFVDQHVIPFLDNQQFGNPKKVVAENWAAWIDQLPGERVTIIVDYVGDSELVHELHRMQQPTKPVDFFMYNSYLGNRRVELMGSDKLTDHLDCWNDCVDIMERLFNSPGVRRHHALDDAKVNRDAFIESLTNSIK